MVFWQKICHSYFQVIILQLNNNSENYIPFLQVKPCNLTHWTSRSWVYVCVRAYKRRWVDTLIRWHESGYIYVCWMYLHTFVYITECVCVCVFPFKFSSVHKLKVSVKNNIQKYVKLKSRELFFCCNLFVIICDLFKLMPMIKKQFRTCMLRFAAVKVIYVRVTTCQGVCVRP